MINSFSRAINNTIRQITRNTQRSSIIQHHRLIHYNNKMNISTVACSHLLLLLGGGGVQAFANMFTNTHQQRHINSSTNLHESSAADVMSVDSTKSTFTTKSSITDEEVCNDIPPSPSSSSTQTTTKIIATDEEFIKSAPDKRTYRAITLPNKLTVLLVSDPTTDVEAASVHVRAGHFDDPANRAGLAHFHEHMLFLGTEKYPKEEEYEDFLGQNGGMSNAYTDMEDTNYYFNVSPLDHVNKDDTTKEDGGQKKKLGGGTSLALSGALDRFSQFFIAPTFDEQMLERELRAVNSEYLNGKTADNWRNYQLIKHGSSSDHPFSKFGCGNYETLTDGGDASLKAAEGSSEEENVSFFGGGSSPRDDLIQFWTDKYHAGNIRLCVVGKASLDDLQKTVEGTFGTVRSPPANFVANGIIDKVSAGLLKLPKEGETYRDENGNFIFQTEHSTYSPSIAFGSEQLGLIREVIPLVEARTLKIFSSVPPMNDPVLHDSKIFRVLSHLVGHESPGSLHHLLQESPLTIISLSPPKQEEGWVNSLASGTGISTSDFCLSNVAITLTPKGMKDRDQVLAKVWQWFALIKDAVVNDAHGLIEQYHNELKTITETSFKYRENGDPTDFCQSSAEKLFDYEPSSILLGSAEVGDYDVDVARAFLERLTPENSLVVITGPELDDEEAEESEVSARDVPWQKEERYGAKYRQIRVSDELAGKWDNPPEIDPRLRLPSLNEFIPEDLSLRCDDQEYQDDFDSHYDYRKDDPKLLIDTPKMRMWHKMDRTFRVPKTSIRLQLTSPDIYHSPRAITFNRLFEKVLSDDLNSYVYDANVAGMHYSVSVVPSAYRINVSGYSEKLPHLLIKVTSRISSLITEMKEGDEAHPALAKLFHKAQQNLLRQTKNYIFESPYETGSYNLRMLLETPVWHINDYMGEMEGADADSEPLTMKECAEMAEKCLFGRSKAVSVSIGNIDEKGAHEVEEVISKHFLKKRPLLDDELPTFRSLKMPNRAEVTKIYGSAPESTEVPLIIEAVAHSEDEENNSLALMIQTASSYELGYEGLVIQELLGSMAYNSAFTQLRTKEQLGYIVSAFVKKSNGGGNAFCVLVQSSNTLPPELEERSLSWIRQFRQEMEEMPDERFKMEAAAVRANLLEKDIKLGEEVSSVWGEILNTVPHGEHFKNPVFDRVEKFANILTLENDDNDQSDTRVFKSASELKKRVLDFYDEYLMTPDRRAVSSRVYNPKAKELFEKNIGKPGVISSYEDAQMVKKHLSTTPTAPYW